MRRIRRGKQVREPVHTVDVSRSHSTFGSERSPFLRAVEYYLYMCCARCLR